MRPEDLHNVSSDSQELPNIKEINGVTSRKKIHNLFIKRLEIVRDKKKRTIHGIKINSSHISAKLASQLENKDRLSENDIASMADATYQAVSKWYKKEYFPATYNLAVLAKSLNVTMEWLLGTSNVMSPTEKQVAIEEHEVFKKYGINIDAFYNLYKFKEEGIDLEKSLLSINYILSHSATTAEKPCFPVVDALNIFFDMYDTGMNLRFSSGKLKSILNTLKQKKDNSELTANDYEYALSKSSFRESPVYTDEVNLDIVGTELKRCKGKLVENIVAELEQSSTPNIEQLMALHKLNDYYNGSTEK